MFANGNVRWLIETQYVIESMQTMYINLMCWSFQRFSLFSFCTGAARIGNKSQFDNNDTVHWCIYLFPDRLGGMTHATKHTNCILWSLRSGTDYQHKTSMLGFIGCINWRFLLKCDMLNALAITSMNPGTETDMLSFWRNFRYSLASEVVVEMTTPGEASV